MCDGIVEAFENTLPWISLFGLVLDASGAILVLGPDIPIVARLATKIERWRLWKLLDELKQEGKVTEGTQIVDELLNESSEASEWGFNVEELMLVQSSGITDNHIRVVMGENLLEGNRTSRYLNDFEGMIEEYRGIEQDYYFAGGSLLLIGFLLQIVSKVGEISIRLSAICLVGSILIAAYLGKRGLSKV